MLDPVIRWLIALVAVTTASSVPPAAHASAPPVPALEAAAASESVQRVARTPSDALSEPAWAEKAAELRRLHAHVATHPDRADHRALEFSILVQLGRAIANANDPTNPGYVDVGGRSLNGGFYLAAILAHRHGKLLALLDDSALRGSVGAYLAGIEQGRFPATTDVFGVTTP